MNRARAPKFSWTLISLFAVLVVFIGLIFVGFMITGNFPPYVSLPSFLQKPTATLEPSATPEILPASISGRVWHDVCASGKEGEPPPDEIPQGCIAAGDELVYQANGLYESGETGIPGIILQLGSGQCPSFGLATELTDQEGNYTFMDLEWGTYCVSIDANDLLNRSLLFPGLWTYPVPTTGMTSITVTVQEGVEMDGINFGWDHQFLPSPSPTPTPTITPTPVICTDAITFVQDVTIADNTNLLPAQGFEKIWRLKNSGTCTWDENYALVFSNGRLMGAPTIIPLTTSVGPGKTVDLKVNLVSPKESGIYRGNWLIRNSDGELFGIGEIADKPFWVQIVVGPAGSTVQGAWRGEYFDNRTLKGTPSMVRDDAVVNFDWGREAPAGVVTADDFSVRWSGKQFFEAGTYRFRILVDDGARLWLDSTLLLDTWKDGAARELTADVTLARGTHDLKLEYYDRAGIARIRLAWEKISTPKFLDWKAEYWDNRELDGDPVLIRNDTKIEFGWGSSSPAVGISKDNFSARWTRTLTFESGTYRFTAYADDGLRVYIDGKLLINEWHQSNGSEEYLKERTLSGQHTIVVEYFERTGEALLGLTWKRIEATPTPTSTLVPTATPTPTAEPTTTPTPTPTETPVPQPQMIYNFVEHYCDAGWASSWGSITCEGLEGDPLGWVKDAENTVLEGGLAVDLPTLLMSPEFVNLGWIEGTFPVYTVQSGDHFRAMIGCLDDHSDCEVGFILNYRIGEGPIQNLGVWEQVYDGEVVQLDLDLTSLAGQTINFILKVYAESASLQNVGVWVWPSIWH